VTKTESRNREIVLAARSRLYSLEELAQVYNLPLYRIEQIVQAAGNAERIAEEKRREDERKRQLKEKIISKMRHLVEIKGWSVGAAAIKLDVSPITLKNWGVRFEMPQPMGYMG
jgi:hypothetical protein